MTDGALGRAGPSPDAAYAAAVAGLPGAGPALLTRIWREWTPEEAWRRIRDGRLSRPRPGLKGPSSQPGFDLGQGPGPSSQVGFGLDAGSTGGSHPDDSWCHLARRLDPPGWWARYDAVGIGVTWPGQPDYPSALMNDPERPGVLFWRGALGHLGGNCVAIVGTRQATPDGRAIAFELGRDLAEAGICVVSGLALGIDGAAHAGALSARGSVAAAATAPAGPAGVAASGVDVPYPRRHARLWERVVEAGVLLSETLPGRPAQAWRFPARNRVIAALVSMVVVVESHARGGSLITAEAAIARGIDVRVVPGPVHSSASAGSNQLLYDGPGPVRSAQDVLDGLGIFLSKGGDRRSEAAGSMPSRARLRKAQGASTSGESQSPGECDVGGLSANARTVLAAVSWRPTSLSQVVDRSRLPVGTVSQALDRLELLGMVHTSGQWWVRRSRP